MAETLITTRVQNIFRVSLALFMIIAGFSHFLVDSIIFEALVPDWIPMSKSLVIIGSGVIEIGLGLGFAFWKKQRINFGWGLALFFILVSLGNLENYFSGKDLFILNSDEARLSRLFFQPVLIIWALWSSGAIKSIKYSEN